MRLAKRATCDLSIPVPAAALTMRHDQLFITGRFSRLNYLVDVIC
jgi:hypothetical protein